MDEPGKIKKVLSSLEPQEYSLRDWNDAIHYLTGETISFTSENDAKMYLLKAEIATKNIERQSPQSGCPEC